jgi:hypothetical protein
MCRVAAGNVVDVAWHRVQNKQISFADKHIFPSAALPIANNKMSCVIACIARA